MCVYICVCVYAYTHVCMYMHILIVYLGNNIPDAHSSVVCSLLERRILSSKWLWVSQQKLSLFLPADQERPCWRPRLEPAGRINLLICIPELEGITAQPLQPHSPGAVSEETEELPPAAIYSLKKLEGMDKEGMVFPNFSIKAVTSPPLG